MLLKICIKFGKINNLKKNYTFNGSFSLSFTNCKNTCIIFIPLNRIDKFLNWIFFPIIFVIITFHLLPITFYHYHYLYLDLNIIKTIKQHIDSNKT